MYRPLSKQNENINGGKQWKTGKKIKTRKNVGGTKQYHSGCSFILNQDEKCNQFNNGKQPWDKKGPL